MLKKPISLIRLFSLFGFLEAVFLTYEHFQPLNLFCPTGGCETVLTSSYAELGGIPIALLGVLFYLSLFIFSFFLNGKPKRYFILLLLTIVGIGASFFLTYLQLYVIKALCFYCLISATINFLLFLTALYSLSSVKSLTKITSSDSSGNSVLPNSS